MPKPRKFEKIQCQYFAWRLTVRDGTFYGDGRSNQPSGGRPSLATSDRAEALRNLARLDLKHAVKIGLARASSLDAAIGSNKQLDLDDGWRLYEQHIKRPRVAGGVK